MKTTQNPQTLRPQQYKALKEATAEQAIRYARTGLGYFTFREMVNDLMEKSGANRACGNNQEAIILGRKAVALDIARDTITPLTVEQCRRLTAELERIAVDDVVLQEHRGFRR